jgi:hypothetical protein
MVMNLEQAYVEREGEQENNICWISLSDKHKKHGKCASGGGANNHKHVIMYVQATALDPLLVCLPPPFVAFFVHSISPGVSLFQLHPLFLLFHRLSTIPQFPSSTNQPTRDRYAGDVAKKQT